MTATPTYTQKKLVGLTAEMASRISAYRFGQRIPSESEAIRRLIELGLSAARQRDAAAPAKARKPEEAAA